MGELICKCGHSTNFHSGIGCWIEGCSCSLNIHEVEKNDIRKQLDKALYELEKWQEYKPDDQDLYELAQQARNKDGTYTNGLAAQAAYIGALEGKLKIMDSKLEIATGALNELSCLSYIQVANIVLDALEKIEQIGKKNELD